MTPLGAAGRAGSGPSSFRRSAVAVDASAITANVERLRGVVGNAEMCAVVKADGYGHGAVTAARAALAGGARWLGVALVEEARVLREAGIDERILLLSEPPTGSWNEVVGLRVDAMVYSHQGIVDAAAAAARSRTSVALHLKVDTGMHRVGCDPTEAVDLVKLIEDSPGVSLSGLCTHFATADETTSMFGAVQIERFLAVDDEIASLGVSGYLRHASNSAAAVLLPKARFDLVRCGIAIYGIEPSPAFRGRIELRPALRLTSAVSFVKRIDAGEPVSYGCRYVSETATTIATVPIGYADGIPRSLGLAGGEVLIAGRRCPIVGTVTMDQMMIDVGGLSVSRDDEVVVIGRQGSDEITANEVAVCCDTIGYEIVTRLGQRLPRVLTT